MAKRIAALFLAFLFATFANVQPVFAEEEYDPYYGALNNIIFYDPYVECYAYGATAYDSTLELTEEQQANASIIIGIAKTYNLGQQGALIGIMTALAESEMENSSSLKVPISLEYPNAIQKDGDADSVGVFQQRASMGWSTYSNNEINHDTIFQLMDVAYAAQAFFGTPEGATLPSDLVNPGALKKGLQNLDNWQSMAPGDAAQAVQISGRPDAYVKRLDAAQQVINKLYDSSPAVPLPISITGGESASGTSSGTCATGTITAAVQLATTYAWPDFKGQGYITLTEAYAAAVKEAQSSGEYVGGKLYAGVDCGGFVTLVIRNSGADPDYNSYKGGTISQKKYLDEHPEKYYHFTASSVDELQPGDIWMRDGDGVGHTFIYVGQVEGFNGNIAEASLDGRAPMASNVGQSDFTNGSWYRLISSGE